MSKIFNHFILLILKDSVIITSLSKSYMLLCVSMLIFLSANAEVTLNALFSNHMVLQRERPIPVWGKATPGEKVSVTFNFETKTTTTGIDGKWMVLLSSQKVYLTPKILKVRGTNEITISDVLVGDVWLGTGQSNMDFTVSGTDGRERFMNSVDELYNGIRLFKVEQAKADMPAEEVGGKWMEPTKQNINGFSAILFFFGEALHERQPGVPLGLIRSSMGYT
ncbi:MAG: hypothetical protein Q8904_01775 [Bacteroidota bacterium]|nr:hypothetical protein [Bacteroidota bacterium]